MDVKLQNFLRMSQFKTLSVAGRNIIDNYLNGIKSIFSNNKDRLVVSLYAQLPDVKSEVLNILKSYTIDLEKCFSKDELAILQEECKAAIRYCYSRKDPDLGMIRPSADHPMQIPESVLELCNSILEVKEGSNIFLPYSASAQFAMLNPNCNYNGFELNSETWALSKIYLDCFGVSEDIKLSGDLEDALPKGKLFDYIFSFPPYISGTAGVKVVNNLYQLATKHLNDNGAMCCILPTNFCTASSGWFDMRKILWDYRNQYSAAIISLPRMLFPFVMSSLDICLFILSKNSQGKVLLMDASSENFCARHDVAGSKEFELKVQSILESITRGDEKYVWGGKVSELVGDVNLLPSRYLISQILPKPQKDEESLSLDKLIEVIPLQRDERIRSIVSQRNRVAHSSSADITQKEAEEILSQYRELEKNAYPLIGMKELSFSYLNCDINREELPSSKKVEYQVLTEDCLLIGFIGGKFKVGRLHGVSQDSPVVLRHEIIPVRLVSVDITADFLLRSIMSEPVQKQAQMMASGVTISRITKQDLLSIVINVPKSKEQQELLMKEDTRSSLTEADKKIIQSYEDFRKDMHMKKHAIGQTIFNLNNWWKVLLRARKEGNGIVDDNTIIGNNNKVAVKDVYENIRMSIEQLQQQISKFDRGNGLVTENISLTKFIEDYIGEHQSPIFRFQYDKTSHYKNIMVDVEEVYDDKGNLIGIKGGREEVVTYESATFAPEALKIIFDNIISNACSHGFAGRENCPEGNIIKIDLYTEGTDHIITISNNGMPVSQNVTEEYVFTYNRSTQNGKNHYGIGGYEVKHLMQEFDGDAEFISQPDVEFPVKYKLIFHNTGIVHIDLNTAE